MIKLYFSSYDNRTMGNLKNTVGFVCVNGGCAAYGEVVCVAVGQFSRLLSVLYLTTSRL